MFSEFHVHFIEAGAEYTREDVKEAEEFHYI
jgi:hypothetical protein